MKKHQLQRIDYAADIASSMATIRGGQSSPMTFGVENMQNVVTPALETFDLDCVCAVHDLPYTMHFEGPPSGILSWKESGRVDASTRGLSRGKESSLTLRLDRLDIARLPCAWCGNNSFHHCQSNCGAFVCGGRMKGERFHCRPSCGATWIGVPLDRVNGTRQQTRPVQPLRPLDMKHTGPMRPAKEPLLLTAGSLPVKVR